MFLFTAYGRYLENDLISETSKEFTKLVLAILKVRSDEQKFIALLKLTCKERWYSVMFLSYEQKEEINTPGKIDYELIEQDVKVCLYLSYHK